MTLRIKLTLLVRSEMECGQNCAFMCQTTTLSLSGRLEGNILAFLNHEITLGYTNKTTDLMESYTLL